MYTRKHRFIKKKLNALNTCHLFGLIGNQTFPWTRGFQSELDTGCQLEVDTGKMRLEDRCHCPEVDTGKVRLEDTCHWQVGL